MTDQTLNGDAAAIVLAQQVVDLGGGHTITLHELTLRQSLTVHARLVPLIDALTTAYAPGGPGVDVQTLLDALAAQPDLACELLALSSGRDPAWIAALPEGHGVTLLVAFIGLHIPFFVTRLELAHQMRVALARQKGSAPSSPDLSATATPGLH